MLNRIGLGIISIYRKFISPFLGPRCRFQPTCSTYAKECFESFSFFKAVWYSCLRILKCHPFSQGGYDPVNNKE